MKMLCVIYADYFDQTITEIFKQAGCKRYIKLHDETGEDESYDARLGSHTAAGKLKTIFMDAPDEEITRLLDIVRRLKADYPSVGMRAFTFPIEEFI
ncbi:MAG TPA: hypothetical protein PLU95_08795 [Syntrophales bacterium]|nr:hypothetical protein [Syntrophales bacterium]HOG91865.1 hypothetical protein [Smithella sp.]HPN09385.1 hypothetical protein [Syntrophales bacterium]HPX82540.1 hypothetical protein [Syntrophales bacterium]HQB14611.1 hypothetical protein [Syntrophales bacterium]